MGGGPGARYLSPGLLGFPNGGGGGRGQWPGTFPHGPHWAPLAPPYPDQKNFTIHPQLLHKSVARRTCFRCFLILLPHHHHHHHHRPPPFIIMRRPKSACAMAAATTRTAYLASPSMAESEVVCRSSSGGNARAWECRPHRKESPAIQRASASSP